MTMTPPPGQYETTYRITIAYEAIRYVTYEVDLPGDLELDPIIEQLADNPDDPVAPVYDGEVRHLESRPGRVLSVDEVSRRPILRVVPTGDV